MTRAPIDLRRVPPLDRHRLIFQSFESLPPGDAMELINNHEPEPLYFMFRKEHPGRFDWQVLVAGPARWHVRVTRLTMPATAAS